MLLGKLADTVGCQRGLGATVFGFRGAQPGLAAQHIGQQCDGQEHRYRHRALGIRREPVGSAADMDPKVNNRARKRGRDRQSKSPAGRDDEDSKQKQHAEDVVRRDMPEQVHHEGFCADQRGGYHDSQPERGIDWMQPQWGGGADQVPLGHAMIVAFLE